MKKAGLLFLVLVILGSYAIKDSEAAQWCWEFEGGGDYIKLSVIKPDSLYPFWSLNGVWYSPDSYVIPLVGTMVKSADGTERVLTIYGTYYDTQAHAINAVIDAGTKNGTFHIHYIYLDSDLDFVINKVNCGAIPAP